MTYRGLLSSLGLASGLIVTSCIIAGSRWKNLESRRAQLNKEYVDILEEMNLFDQSRLNEAEELRRKRKETTALLETVNTLWTDRFERYVQANKELHSCLHALPEALGALKGLTSHYQYMAAEMRKFIAFDVACTKMHNLALLLDHGDRVGIARVVDTIRQLFVAEPLVQVVCESVSNEAGLSASCPSTMCEASMSFGFCLQELEKAIEMAVAQYAELHDAPSQCAPNALCEGVCKIISQLRLSTLSSGDIEMQKERQTLHNLLLRDRRQLRTTDDVFSAMSYAADVATKLSRVDGGAAHEALRTAISNDDGVKVAREQLLLWRKAAAVFLVRQQAQEALGAYHLLLAETLTKVKAA